MTDTHNLPAIVERGEVQQQLSPMVAAIMQASDGKPDMALLEKAMDLQERWEKNQAKKMFDAALVELKASMPSVIGRDKEVDFTGNSGKRTRYTHTTLGRLIEAVTPHLSRFGFSLSWVPSTNGTAVSVTCNLAHRGGHTESTTLTAQADSTGNKSPQQGIASTVTLLERYTAQALLGIASADMPEPTGEAAPPPDNDAINTKRNMNAVAALKKYDKTREQAEQFLGRKVAEWTAADIGKLQAWLKPQNAVLAMVLEKVKTATRQDLDTIIEHANKGLTGEDLATANAAIDERAAFLGEP